MSFQDIMKDKVKIIKANGNEFGPVKANVQSNGIYLMSSEFLIEPNDSILRMMSNGGTETFKVIDPGFRESSGPIPAHYQMKVEKNNLPSTNKSHLHQINTFYGANSRVNNNSIDNSLNVSSNEQLLEQVRLLKEEVENKLLSPQEKQDAIEIIDAIQTQVQSKKPSKMVVKSLVSSLPHVGNIASIGTLLVSILG